MRRAAFSLAPLACLLAATSLHAQEPEDDRIVVEGKRADAPTRREAMRQARAVTASDNQRETPLARFEDPVCFGVAGLAQDHAALLIDRLRDNAAMLDLRLRGDGCSPNFLVVFAPDALATVEGLRKSRPLLFTYLNPGERAELAEPGPVHVLADVEPRTLTGMPIARVRNLEEPPRMGVHAAHTRIYTTTRRDIASVMVIFTADAVRGFSIGQLADYATMRGLARTRGASDPALDTILALFAPDGAPPAGLTDFDRAYLQALYTAQPNLPALVKLAGVGQRLEELQGED